MTNFERTSLDEWHSRLGRSLLLEMGQGVSLAFKWLDWDTNYFSVPCYAVETERCVLAQGADLSMVRPAALPHALVFAKIAGEARLVPFLEKIGFELIETEINLEYDSDISADALSCPEGIVVQQCSPVVLDRSSFLGSGFTATRFHTDPRIGREKADGLWRSYISNYSGENKAGFAAIEQSTGDVRGLILVSIAGLGGAAIQTLDVVVVHPEERSRGIGAYLMQQVIAFCKQRGGCIRVSSQQRNSRAVSFYVNNGFTKQLPSRRVYHWWSSPEKIVP